MTTLINPEWKQENTMYARSQLDIPALLRRIERPDSSCRS
jgi:hypothetical protein